MIPFQMRLARPEDKAAVTEIAFAIDPEDYVPEFFDEFVAGGRFWVAEQDGRVIGCHAHDWAVPGQMYLFAMRLDPAMQGKGIGSAYCRAQIERGVQLGARELWLNSVVGNVVAHRTVEKNGFVKRGEWICYDQLPVDMLPPGPSAKARAGRSADLPLLAPFRALFLGDVMGGPDDPYHTASARDEDWVPEDLVVVEDGDGGLAGAMLLRETPWAPLYVRRLEGTPEAAAELLSYAGAEGRRRGKQVWAVSLPARAEHLLAPAHVDPAKAFRTYAFQHIAK
jgi:GNAT superfamily N-acetyltransferase